ncbi:uncharacterized protein LOC109822205 [Asparagus officinalis]|uniref:uncharacterized protein LOC109822205 n=1 Tax=Asparagus officinalis TaxID=4686 RepID=UPI00098E7220|nr:uncharacterized protein LOC109822205 [Asparagus officinalis]
MQLAAIPMDLNEPPPTDPLDPHVAVHSCIDLVNVRPEVTRMPEGEDNLGGYTDCPTGRQASLLRYREKRKERYKGKRIIGGLPSNMEMMFLSQKFKGQVPTEQSSQSNTSSAYPRPPCMPTTCSSVENPAQKFHISFDLNDDGGGS